MHRRHFLAGLAAATAALRCRGFAAAPRRLILDPTTLTPWVDELPRLAWAQPIAMRPDPEDPHRRLPFYPIRVAESRWRFHRDLPPTRVWSYGGSFPGPTIEARRNAPILAAWTYALPRRHFLPIDRGLMGAGPGVPEVRGVVHLHGGRVPRESDGFPEDWKVPGQTQLCRYPNAQEAATLWYHDHAMGINRLNVFAGMLGLYLLRDEEEERLGLPSGEDELALAICDRDFDRDGELFYPTSGDPMRPWIPEFQGSAITLNGALWPHLSVRPRTYRWRVLNGSNARFLNLSFTGDVSVAQIGGDQGLLDRPVKLERLVLAPAERADLLVDFRRAAATCFLKNDLVEVMRVRVGGAPGPAPAPLPPRLREPVPPAAPEAKTRRITLLELVTPAGMPAVMLLNGKRWHEPVTERPVLGSTEIWELVNTTDESHPIHLHLARFRVLDRRSFDQDEFLRSGRLRYMAAAQAPEAGENGWKDTVRAHGGMVTRIQVEFAGYAGRYVYHCHILEHEANEMMRPFEVVSRG